MIRQWKSIDTVREKETRKLNLESYIQKQVQIPKKDEEKNRLITKTSFKIQFTQLYTISNPSSFTSLTESSSSSCTSSFII